MQDGLSWTKPQATTELILTYVPSNIKINKGMNNSNVIFLNCTFILELKINDFETET